MKVKTLTAIIPLSERVRYIITSDGNNVTQVLVDKSESDYEDRLLEFSRIVRLLNPDAYMLARCRDGLECYAEVAKDRRGFIKSFTSYNL